MRSAVEHPPGPATPETTPAWSTDDWRDEVILDQLSAGDAIVLTTRNHTYEIFVTSPWTGDVLVRGGRFFPTFTVARLVGSLVGGRSVKMRSVTVGCPLEFADSGHPVITTRVRDVRVVPVAA